MAFDGTNHRLFIGRGNKMMLMVDSTNDKAVAHVPAGDPHRHDMVRFGAASGLQLRTRVRRDSETFRVLGLSDGR